MLVGLFLILLCSSGSVFLLLLLPVSSLNDEGFVLLSFKHSISQDPEGAFANWDSSHETPCSWNGVGCNGETVVSLTIPKKNLYGFVPSSLGALSGLRHLNLRNNRLYGNLPFQLFSAQGLQSLVLYGNFFSGSVPNGIGKLKNLQTLDLSQNFFNGSLPTSIIQCKRLRTLDIRQNNFSGSLPRGFGTSLSSLEKLDLSFNKFSGSLPSDLGNLSSLQGTFDLSYNLFSGLIPASLGNLPEKVYIDLSHNNLSGPIPQNGALMNRGPTAFVGNPGLCGSPLKNSCSSEETLSASSPSLLPFLPDDLSPGISGENAKKAGGLSKSAVIAIVLGDVVGICLVGLLFSYCYSKVCNPRKSKDESGCGSDKGKGRNECLCFSRKDESETVSQNVEQYDLVALDGQVAFDLDELLKATAFVLGKSGIGIVYKVVLEDAVTLAVRRLGEGGSQRFKEFQTEVEAIAKLRHPNLVTLRAYYWSVDEKLLIYDFIPNGNLAIAIHGKPGTVAFTPLSWSARLKIMEGVAKGMVYLHEFSPKKYVHGDLKPNNILLSQNMEAKISDFGLARLANIAGGTPTLQSNRMASEKPKTADTICSSSSYTETGTGTCYQAPESLKAMMKPSQKWDVYSYGVILLEIITGRFPLIQMGSSSEMDLVHWIQLCIEQHKPLSEVIDPYLVQDASYREEDMISVLKIAMACVHGSPERRPPMRHIFDALERVSSSASRN